MLLVGLGNVKSKKSWRRCVLVDYRLLLLSKELRPLLLSKILPKDLQDKIYPQIDILIDQVTDVLSRATESLRETYNLGTLESKSQLLSHVVLLLMVARVGIARLAIIFLILSTLSALANNELLINAIENMESSLSFDNHLISNVLREYPKQISNMLSYFSLNGSFFCFIWMCLSLHENIKQILIFWKITQQNNNNKYVNIKYKQTEWNLSKYIGIYQIN